MPSLKKNIFWNALRTGSNLLFPLITFPYVTRILGPEPIGLFNYVYAIAAYFTLFASLGFPIYGIREIANVKDNKEKMTAVVNAIFTANTIATVIVYAAYCLTAIFIGGNNQLLYFVIGLSVLMSCISFDWFYQGIEDFKFITIRSCIIKLLSVAALFVFVRKETDILPYAILTIAGTCGNNIVNLIHIRKFLRLRLSFKDCWKHTKGASILFLGTIAISLYTNLNNIMIGAMDSMDAVGFFSTGNKIINLLLTVISAVTSTIIPRMSYLVGRGKEEEALALQRKTLNLINYISLPLVAGLIIFARPLILIFSGDQFLPAVIVLQILSVLLIVIPWSSFLGLQILYPARKEKYGNYCVIIGAVVNLVLNYILIPRYSFLGVAVSVVIAESTITLTHYLFSMRYMKLHLRDFIPLRAILSTAVMAALLMAVSTTNRHTAFLLVWTTVGAAVYLLCLLLLKDKFTKDMLLKIIKK